jgi:hypothetical protein
MRELPGAEAGWIERESPSDGCTLALMTVFGIADVRAFAAAKSRGDLKFRAVHEAGGIGFANARDPAGDSIQMSGEALRADADTPPLLFCRRRRGRVPCRNVIDCDPLFKLPVTILAHQRVFVVSAVHDFGAVVRAGDYEIPA